MTKRLRFVLIFTLALSVTYPAFSQQIRGNYEESEYNRELRNKRAVAFSPWMSKAQMNTLQQKSALNGQVLLILERNPESKMRAFFYFPEKKGTKVSYATAVSDPQLLAMHVKQKKNGYELLFLSKNPSGIDYCATWIEKDGYKGAIGTLAKLGVTPAKIQINPTRKTGPVTSDNRQWTDKSGRIIEAALTEIDGDKIILEKKGGGKFPYSISNLSMKDQQFLKQRIAAHQKPDSGTSAITEKNGDFTDWQSFYAWNERLKEEKSKGRYPVYVENNKDRELRGIFDKQPDGLQWQIGWLESENDLLKMNKSYQSEGMTILSLSFDRRNELYYGIWVSKTTLKQAKTQLESAKVSAADIGRKIKVSRVSKK